MLQTPRELQGRRQGLNTQQLSDAQQAVELDQNNLKAHFLIGEALCNLGKSSKDAKKIDTAITRMSKGRQESNF